MLQKIEFYRIKFPTDSNKLQKITVDYVPGMPISFNYNVEFFHKKVLSGKYEQVTVGDITYYKPIDIDLDELADRWLNVLRIMQEEGYWYTWHYLNNYTKEEIEKRIMKI